MKNFLTTSNNLNRTFASREIFTLSYAKKFKLLNSKNDIAAMLRSTRIG